MILSLLGYFDLGISLGVDDDVFSGETLKTPSRPPSMPLEVRRDCDATTLDLQNSFGNGLSLDLSGSSFLHTWMRGAQQDESFSQSSLNFKAFKIVACHGTIYSIGLGTVLLTIENLSCDGLESITDFAHCFSRAINLSAAGELRKVAGEALDPYRSNCDMENATARTFRHPNEFVPGMIFICHSETEEEWDKILPLAQAYESPQPLAPSLHDRAEVRIGSSITIIRPCSPADTAYVMNLLQVGQLYLGVVDVFQWLFSNKLRSLLKPRLGLEAEKMSGRAVEMIRILAETIVESTDPYDVSWDVGDRHLLDAFAEVEKLDQRRRRIRELSARFYEIWNDVAKAEEVKREKRLNTFILVLTALTFLSVVSDIICTVDYTHVIVPSPVARFVLLAAPPGAAMLAIWLIVRRKKPE